MLRRKIAVLLFGLVSLGVASLPMSVPLAYAGRYGHGHSDYSKDREAHEDREYENYRIEQALREHEYQEERRERERQRQREEDRRQRESERITRELEESNREYDRMIDRMLDRMRSR